MCEQFFDSDHLMRPELFESVFVNRENFSNLKELALAGGLGAVFNRFVSWKVFLGILPKDFMVEQWVERTVELRREYGRIVEEITTIKAENLDPLIFNPLSPASQNPWNSYYIDNELKNTIRKDLEAAFEDRPLFQSQNILDLMVRVLFHWSKRNSSVSYKQGMSELLAIIVFVALAERCPENLGEISLKSKEILNILNDPNGTEADCFWCFHRIMEAGLMDMFSPAASKLKDRVLHIFTWESEKPFKDVQGHKHLSSNTSNLMRRCQVIHHCILQTIDKELYLYLERQSIDFQLYLQRYIKCMLSKEFNINDTLILWDAILGHFSSRDFRANDPEGGSKEFRLLDYICVAMLVFVRAFGMNYLVLQSDNPGILKRLLKFPPVEDVRILISMAAKYEKIMNEKVEKNASPPKPVHAIFTPLKSIETSKEKVIKQGQEEVKAKLVDEESVECKKTLIKVEVGRNQGEKEEGSIKVKEDVKEEKAVVAVVKQSEKKDDDTPKVLIRSENSLVEKCNAALLLLLEQSDEQVYQEDKMTKALQVLYSLKEDICRRISQKNE